MGISLDANDDSIYIKKMIVVGIIGHIWDIHGISMGALGRLMGYPSG